jgi:hypothetical protein
MAEHIVEEKKILRFVFVKHAALHSRSKNKDCLGRCQDNDVSDAACLLVDCCSEIATIQVQSTHLQHLTEN